MATVWVCTLWLEGQYGDSESGPTSCEPPAFIGASFSYILNSMLCMYFVNKRRKVLI